MDKAKQRQREQEIVYERKLAKERSQDDHLYAEKDKFVTSAYKKKLAEQEKWMEEERLRQLREEKEDVTKKKDMTDFYFGLHKNVAFGGGEVGVRKSEKQSKEVVGEVGLRKSEKKSKEVAGEVGLRKSEEQSEEMVTKSPEKVLPSRNLEAESSKVIKRHENDVSVSPRRESDEADAKPVSPRRHSDEADAKPVSNASTQDNAVNEPIANEQPSDNHHKRTQDALSEAKQRFLARKKAKEQELLDALK